MEQSRMVDTLKTSLKSNLWAQRSSIIVLLIVVIISIVARINLFMFLEALLLTFLVTGIIAFGFAGIALHIRYYFRFEKNRTVELYTDRIVISENGQFVKQVFKNDITRIILRDTSRTAGSPNFNITLMDTYYYLVVIDKNQESLILTCLLDSRLKKKIAAWYGQELEHKYQFFPFPRSS